MAKLKQWLQFLGWENLLGKVGRQENSIVMGCRRLGALRAFGLYLCSPQGLPSPTQGPGNLQPLQQAEVIVSFCLGPDLSNKLTSQVAPVTRWPRLTRAPPQTLLVVSETRGAYRGLQPLPTPKGVIMKFCYKQHTKDRRPGDLILRMGPGPGVAEYGGFCPRGSPYSSFSTCTAQRVPGKELLKAPSCGLRPHDCPFLPSEQVCLVQGL